MSYVSGAFGWWKLSACGVKVFKFVKKLTNFAYLQEIEAELSGLE
jgi:hypothetical protein